MRMIYRRGCSDDPDYQEILDQQDVSKADLYSVSQLVKRRTEKEAFFSPSDRDGSDVTANTDSKEKWRVIPPTDYRYIHTGHPKSDGHTYW